MPWWRFNWYGKCAWRLRPATKRIWSPVPWDDGDYCREILARDPCAYCGGEVDCIDHITPRASNGENHVDNLAPVCWPCNSLKAARPIWWIMHRRLDREEEAAALALEYDVVRMQNLKVGASVVGTAMNRVPRKARIVASIEPVDALQYRVTFDDGTLKTFRRGLAIWVSRP